MKWSFAGVGVIVAGLVGVGILILFQSLTTSNEQDYYLLKEVTEAAMVDSIDKAYYMYTGDYKIIEQKFVENFVRRFAESASFKSSGYTLEFYDIIEAPPKVSVRVVSSTDTFVINGDETSFSASNSLDAILEFDEIKNGGG